MAKCAAARTYDGSTRRVRIINHGAPYDLCKIELTVAVCIGTGKLEESACRRIELMRLGCWRVSTSPFKPELKAKLLNAGKCRTQCQCCGPATTQPFATAFRGCGRFLGVESHDGSSPVGSIT